MVVKILKLDELESQREEEGNLEGYLTVNTK